MEAINIRKRADKSGPPPAPGQAWPFAGVELTSAGGPLPDTFDLPTSTVRRGIAEGWITASILGEVTRPSQADPDTDDTGSTVPSGAHLIAAGTVEDPAPHRFLHIERLTFHTTDGPVSYVVELQPDKYAVTEDGIDPDAQVTPDVYAAGDTAVFAAYRLTLEG